ncbi:MAG TPA: hypothetical protein VFL90_07655, partial [Methylomirabilota bacterium]|nr:hypothetical protein [Methylomirabilota bacterium]
PAGYSPNSEVYRSTATGPAGTTGYPAASPREVIVTPPASAVVVTPPPAATVVVPGVVAPTGPIMCPGINRGDPRRC